jgi:hypothetical protein
MAYLTVSDAKAYLGIAVADTTEDTLLGLLITAAQSAIDAYCGRAFEAATETRFYGRSQVLSQELRLDRDLLSVTTLTNGDGTVIGAANYVLLPRNSAPRYAIRLKSTTNWIFATDDSEITVAGSWGYSATAPGSVVQATREYVDYLYRTSDTRRGLNVSEGAAGAVIARSGDLPDHIARLLGGLKRISR